MPRLSFSRWWTALAAVLLLVTAVPAHAVVEADFDGDGVLDSVAVGASAGAAVHVSLSSRADGVRLHLRERPLRLVAVDVNHDGRADLAGLLPRRGVVLFTSTAEGFHRVRLPRARHVARRAARRTALDPFAYALRSGSGNSPRSIADLLRDDDSGDALPIEPASIHAEGPAGATADRPCHRLASAAHRLRAARAPPA